MGSLMSGCIQDGHTRKPFLQILPNCLPPVLVSKHFWSFCIGSRPLFLPGEYVLHPNIALELPASLADPPRIAGSERRS